MKPVKFWDSHSVIDFKFELIYPILLSRSQKQNLTRQCMNKTIEKLKRYIKLNLTALAWVIVIAVSMYYYVSLMFSG